MTLEIKNLQDLFSIITIRTDSETSPLEPQADTGLKQYAIAARDCFAADTFRRNLLRNASGETECPEMITPWVIFLESDEFLTKLEIGHLTDYCRSAEKAPALLPIERFISRQTMSGFSWVTTEKELKSAAPDIRKYLSLEIRLVPTERLNAVRILEPPTGSDRAFVIQFPPEENLKAQCPALVSREEEPDSAEPTRPPDDRAVFKDGHQKYFSDTSYSDRFVWPHTVYHTIRYDHVRSVIEALKQGLSNPIIVMYTLIYLLRFRHFSLASEIIALIPDHWYARHPDMTNGVATLHFIEGRHEKALGLYDYILNVFPDSDWIAQNAIKLNILAGRYDAVERIFEQYREATGNELQDDYSENFKAVHGRSPQRTASLSVCLIIRDEGKTIERAITSVRQFADEIIVVDTGSRDRSVEIAESLGARIYHFSWSDDFSAARNFAISKATCDYIFMLDGDESISPFFFIEAQLLKKLLPLNERCAYTVQIGTYFNETDWLFVTREEGNYKIETEATRLFPRLPGVEFSGVIAETILPALSRKRIPIKILPKEMLQIVHAHGERKRRVARKVHIYKKLENLHEEVILCAIRDFSLMGDQQETLGWLQSFYDRHEEREGKIRMGLHLSGLLEQSDPLQAENLFRQLSHSFPGSKEVTAAYAGFLLTANRLEEIRNLSFAVEPLEEKGTLQQSEYRCLWSLHLFESGKTDDAFQILTEILSRNAFQIFPQALRFYFLLSMQEIEGAVSTMDDLFYLAGRRKSFKIDHVADLFVILEELCTLLLKSGHRKESSLILYGMSKLGKAWGVL